MLRIFLLIVALSLLALGMACGQDSSVPGVVGGASTPTEAYKQLFAAVKSKDVESIKRSLTQKTIEFGAMAAQRNNTPVEKIYENGFTATTFSETLPEMRDERITENMASLEVWNSRDSKWEDLPFINENGGWKLAVGDMFAGSFVSPGPGLDQKEKAAANSATNKPTNGVSPNSAVNAPIPVKKGPNPLAENINTKNTNTK